MPAHLARLALALVSASALSGCMAYSNVKRDTDRQPIVNTGVGAMVLMPGQGAPSMPDTRASRMYGGAPAQPGYAAPPGQAPPPGYGAQPGYGGSASGSYNNSGTGSSGGGSGYAAGPPGGAPSAGPNIQFIGGAELDEVKHREIKQEPLIIKTLLAPVAAVAWPFKKAYEAAQGDPQPVVAPPMPQAPPPGPPDYEAAYEEQQLQALENQLGGPGAGAAPAPSAAPAGPGAQAYPAPSAAGARPSSIADELALLQRRVPPRGVAPGASGGPAATPPGVADRVNDADGDGRPDQWQYRENGVLVRELFDQNGDGRVDRTVLYDPATGQKRSEEDDANQDGRVDSWVEYQGDQVVRRRQDESGDGEPDAWTFYRGGQLARVEEDRNGDGFRDRVGYYEAGKLARETEDSNGDGRPDRITLYDAQERVRQRSEDRDGDGLVDARSFYENGKLVRKELVDEGVGAETLEEEGLGTSGDFSDGAAADDATPSQTSGGHAPAPAPSGDEG